MKIGRPKVNFTCKQATCQKAATAKQLCDTHYRRWLHWGNADYIKPSSLKKLYRTGTPKHYSLPDNQTRSTWVKYAAGLFDGEGCATFHIGSNHYVMSPRIQVTNCNKSCLQLMNALFGGRVAERVRSNPAYATAYYWQATGTQSTNALKEMLPFLIIKKPQAEILIEFQDKRPHTGRHRPVSQAERKRRQLLISQIRTLNKRGA